MKPLSNGGQTLILGQFKCEKHRKHGALRDNKRKTRSSQESLRTLTWGGYNWDLKDE